MDCSLRLGSGTEKLVRSLADACSLLIVSRQMALVATSVNVASSTAIASCWKSRPVFCLLAQPRIQGRVLRKIDMLRGSGVLCGRAIASPRETLTETSCIRPADRRCELLGCFLLSFYHDDPMIVSHGILPSSRFRATHF